MPQPNIVCDSVYLSPQAEVVGEHAHLTPSQPIVVRVPVRNDGDADATAFRVRIWLDHELHELRMDALEAGGWQWVEWYHDPLAAGQHKVVIVCDFKDTVHESVEADNRYEHSFEVRNGDARYDFTDEGLEIEADMPADRTMKKKGWQKAYVQLIAHDVDEHGIEGAPLAGHFKIVLDGDAGPNSVEGETTNGILKFRDVWVSAGGNVEILGQVQGGAAVTGTSSYEIDDNRLTLHAQRKHWYRTVTASSEQEATEMFGQQVGGGAQFEIINVSASATHESSTTRRLGEGSQWEVHARSLVLGISQPSK